jgi:hypothetical protein
VSRLQLRRGLHAAHPAQALDIRGVGLLVVDATRYAEPVTKREQREAAAILERLAAVVARGEVTAPAGFVGRLEGAAEALRVSSSHTRSGSLRTRA